MKITRSNVYIIKRLCNCDKTHFENILKHLRKGVSSTASLSFDRVTGALVLKFAQFTFMQINYIIWHIKVW
jgi:hypothetical protein